MVGPVELCSRAGSRRESPRALGRQGWGARRAHPTPAPQRAPESHITLEGSQSDTIVGSRGNDPSAGSPTETLLRLHLPLNGKV